MVLLGLSICVAAIFYANRRQAQARQRAASMQRPKSNLDAEGGLMSEWGDEADEARGPLGAGEGRNLAMAAGWWQPGASWKPPVEHGMGGWQPKHGQKTLQKPPEQKRDEENPDEEEYEDEEEEYEDEEEDEGPQTTEAQNTSLVQSAV